MSGVADKLVGQLVQLSDPEFEEYASELLPYLVRARMTRGRAAVQSGRSITDVARGYGVTPRAVRKWLTVDGNQVLSGPTL